MKQSKRSTSPISWFYLMKRWSRGTSILFFWLWLKRLTAFFGRRPTKFDTICTTRLLFRCTKTTFLSEQESQKPRSYFWIAFEEVIVHFISRFSWIVSSARNRFSLRSTSNWWEVKILSKHTQCCRGFSIIKSRFEAMHGPNNWSRLISNGPT